MQSKGGRFAKLVDLSKRGLHVKFKPIGCTNHAQERWSSLLHSQQTALQIVVAGPHFNSGIRRMIRRSAAHKKHSVVTEPLKTIPYNFQQDQERTYYERRIPADINCQHKDVIGGGGGRIYRNASLVFAALTIVVRNVFAVPTATPRDSESRTRICSAN